MGALLALAGLLQVALSLKIAAFNIRTFGETKMSNATLSHYIVQVSPGGAVPEEPQGGERGQCLTGPGNTGPAVSPEGTHNPGWGEPLVREPALSAVPSHGQQQSHARPSTKAPREQQLNPVGTCSGRGPAPQWLCRLPSSASPWPCP